MKPERTQRLERLVDASPQFEHAGTWLSFYCPIHRNEDREDMTPMERAEHFCRVAIPLRKPDDRSVTNPPSDGWDFSGTDFETLTISPSIARRGGANGCEWHGFIRDGRFEHCGDSK